MKKLMNKKGFTLMEMLIVVAIIVILVAVSIPTFTSQLDKAKSATDAANLRAAKAVAQNVEMMGQWSDYVSDIEDDTTLYYNIDKGTFEENYSGSEYGNGGADKEVIYVTIKSGSMEKIDWCAKPE